MRIYTVFNSIDGEANYWGQGTFSTFVRFAGCNLTCKYCDTKDAIGKRSGIYLGIDQLISIIENYGCKKVTITGGEPLLQSASVKALIIELWERGYKISVETNGTFPILNFVLFEGDISWVVDYKLQFSDKMNIDAFNQLTEKDIVKILVWDHYTIDTAETVRKELMEKGCGARFFVSPIKITPSEAVNYLRTQKYFNLSLNIQLHKYINQP
jgi:7-carboxy-7-deazaguanine synthase